MNVNLWMKKVYILWIMIWLKNCSFSIELDEIWMKNVQIMSQIIIQWIYFHLQRQFKFIWLKIDLRTKKSQSNFRVKLFCLIWFQCKQRLKAEYNRLITKKKSYWSKTQHNGWAPAKTTSSRSKTTRSSRTSCGTTSSRSAFPCHGYPTSSPRPISNTSTPSSLKSKCPPRSDSP